MGVDFLGREDPTKTDPDPFTIGLGLFGAIAGGGSFLEARRLRQTAERQRRDAFSATWYSCRRTLIHFKRATDEFETYILEDNYGKSAFRIGAVRISVDLNRRKSMRRLNGQAMTTANHMADNLDDLSEFLGEQDQPAVDKILARLSQIGIPDTYRDLIKLSREATELYSDFLNELGEREGFGRES